MKAHDPLATWRRLCARNGLSLGGLQSGRQHAFGVVLAAAALAFDDGTTYTEGEVNERLKPVLQRTLKPGARVVSHDFLMGDDWRPEKEVTVRDADGQEHTLYLWTIRDKK